MITLILTIHVILATLYTTSIIGLAIAAALRKVVPSLHAAGIAGFVSTISTGSILVIVSPKAMAQFCTSTLIATAFGVIAWGLYKRRALSLQPEKTTVY